jgi:predicted RNA-binding protein Jag
VQGIPPGAPYSSEEAVRLVAGRILREMGLELRARLRDREGAIVLELGGTDSAILLDNEGEVIEALQHVLNKILSRDERFESRVIVDCEGYRSKHDEVTVERARAAADEALRTGKPVQLEGLNPYERPARAPRSRREQGDPHLTRRATVRRER